MLWTQAPAQSTSDLYYLNSGNAGFRPYAKIPMRLGNGFKAMGDDTLITVKLIGNDATDSGTLYFLNPMTGQEILLFSNKDTVRFGQEVILGKAMRGAPIVFKYVNSRDNQPKYTGANKAGRYDFYGDPLLEGLAINGRPMPVSTQMNTFGDRRWAVAGRASRGEVLFGFEDLALGAGHDFNDIVFLLTGVQLDSEIKLPAPLILESDRTGRTAQISMAMPTTSAAPDVRIFYTLDGTAPYYDENGPVGSSTRVYAGAFPVTGNTTVRAISWRPSVEDSTVGITRYMSSDEAKVLILFTTPAEALSGVYLDEDGDGRIDAARLDLAGSPAAPPASLFLEDPFRPGDELELTFRDLTLAAGPPGAILARFPDRPFAFGTGFAARPYATLPASEAFTGGAFSLRDSVGPVLAAVEASPPLRGNPAWMQAVFSEEVIVNAGSPAFPFAIRRGALPDPNGKVVVSSVRRIDGRTWLYIFAPDSPFYPVPGDSLRLLDHPSVADLRGLRSNMGFHVGVRGPPAAVRGGITATGGDFTVGGTLYHPLPLKVPVSVVQEDPAAGPGSLVCLDCRTGEWRSQDPGRPASFPEGPRIQISTRGPFAFDISFFSHLGEFVNRAQGIVTAAMLAGVPADLAGNKHVSLMWYPVSPSGHQAGTGAYIAQGSYQTLPAPGLGRQGEPVIFAPERSRIGMRFGYVRK